MFKGLGEEMEMLMLPRTLTSRALEEQNEQTDRQNDRCSPEPTYCLCKCSSGYCPTGTQEFTLLLRLCLPLLPKPELVQEHHCCWGYWSTCSHHQCCLRELRHLLWSFCCCVSSFSFLAVKRNKGVPPLPPRPCQHHLLL